MNLFINDTYILRRLIASWPGGLKFNGYLDCDCNRELCFNIGQ